MTRPSWAKDISPPERIVVEWDHGRTERAERPLKKKKQQRELKKARPKLLLKKLKLRLKSKQSNLKPKPAIKRVNGRVAHALKDTAEFKIGDPVPERRYTAVSRDVYMCPEVKALSHWAKHLLLCLLLQYDGHNNGKLKCSFAYLHENFGWGSPNSLLKARRNLEHARLLARIEEAYKGRAARYGLINCLVPQKGVEK